MRLVIPAGNDFELFRKQYEAAVPAFEPDLIEGAADWSEVQTRTAARATHGFLLYGRVDVGPMMALAGHTAASTAYLMGNHTIAETMYGHNAGVMLYAPLRTVIYEDPSGATMFAIDQPSSRFDDFGDPDIAATGRLLDQKVATLLEVLGLPVPDALRPGS